MSVQPEQFQAIKFRALCRIDQKGTIIGGEAMRLDAHAHIIPEDCLQLAYRDPSGRAFGIDASLAPDGHWNLEVDGMVRSPIDTAVDKPFQDWLVHMFDLERRFHHMKELHIDAQVVAIPHFLYFYMAEGEAGLTLARRLNDSLARLVHSHPDRLVGLATVPLQDPVLAAQELRRAIDTLGLQGVVIDCNVNGRNLDEPPFREFFASAEELNVPVFLHPRYLPNQEGLERYHLANLVGIPFQTTIAVASLIFGGVLDDFPRLKVYLAHAGGCVPYICGRWDQGWRNVAAARQGSRQAPGHYLRRFHYDTISHSGPALSFLANLVGADRIVLGTDYPFDVGDYHPFQHIRSLQGVTEEEKQGIVETNAPRLFGVG